MTQAVGTTQSVPFISIWTDGLRGALRFSFGSEEQATRFEELLKPHNISLARAADETWTHYTSYSPYHKDREETIGLLNNVQRCRELFINNQRYMQYPSPRKPGPL